MSAKAIAERLNKIRNELDLIADTLTQPYSRDLRRASEFVLHVERVFDDKYQRRR